MSNNSSSDFTLDTSFDLTSDLEKIVNSPNKYYSSTILKHAGFSKTLQFIDLDIRSLHKSLSEIRGIANPATNAPINAGEVKLHLQKLSEAYPSQFYQLIQLCGFSDISSLNMTEGGFAALSKTLDTTLEVIGNNHEESGT